MVKVLEFIATVSHQGRMRVIVVPKRLHKKLGKIEGKQLHIILDDVMD